MEVPDKRKMIQSIIDDEEAGWIIMKPSIQNPNDPDRQCVFENSAKLTEATIEIPNEWFHQHELEKIRAAIHEGLQQARVKLKNIDQEA